MLKNHTIVGLVRVLDIRDEAEREGRGRHHVRKENLLKSSGSFLSKRFVRLHDDITFLAGNPLGGGGFGVSPRSVRFEGPPFGVI